MLHFGKDLVWTGQLSKRFAGGPSAGSEDFGIVTPMAIGLMSGIKSGSLTVTSAKKWLGIGALLETGEASRKERDPSWQF
ncbi:hypothetical protein, partial [Erythrobacter sp. HI0019]|uniref:hypothetical protein n=1 Tax=Erythrobacter sp. HI0019 TaxID=1822222 RepID=UPI001F45A972